jgi:hypothetical protein
MNFPPYWARGQSGDFFSWRWSFRSAEEAQALAGEAAQKLADRIKRREVLSRHQGYYPGRPFREQILREVKNDSGEVIGVITRNSYGCSILNTARVMFVDVDLPEPKPSGGFLNRLFGKPAARPPTDHLQNAVVAKAENWMRSNSGWGWRIYRTRAGMRLLATHALFDPEAAVSNGVFDALGADPLYTQLCKSQKCFRARLTPKPWRCGVYDKPERWPFLTPKLEARFQKWEAGYQANASEFATCRLISACGNTSVHPDAQRVVAIHDEATRTASKLNLA